ncbi:MAG: CheR family methyltransferase [bacterium]
MTTFEEIKEILKSQVGINPNSMDFSEFDSKADNFLQNNELDSYESLLKILKSKPNMLMAFTENKLNSETWFLRNPDVYELFNKYLHSLTPKDEYDKLRVLSIGCSTGEEPYSIAILLLASGLNPNNFIIDGIDISATAIEFAKQAVYSASSIHEMDIGLLEKYFQQAEDLFILNPKIAHLVVFHKVNFIEQNFFTGRKQYDIIFAKNIFNTLTEDAIRKLLNNISSVMSDTGILITTDNEVQFINLVQFQKSEYGGSSFIKKKRENKVEEKYLQSEKKTKRKVKFLPNIFRINKNIEVAKNNVNEKTFLELNETKSIQEIRQLISIGSFDNAMSSCLRLLKKGNQNPDLYYFLGYIYEQQNDLIQAEDFYHKALYLEPYHYETLIKLIVLFENKGKTDRAELLKKRIDKITGKQ